VGPLNLLLWGVGIVLIAAGYLRARGPWQRYQALKEQDANVARYEAWRGGVRDDSKTGASVAMDILRRQAQIGAAIAIGGIVLVFLGFLLLGRPASAAERRSAQGSWSMAVQRSITTRPPS
jgi:hypothetical protein